ncbi:MAG: DMT family transporter, partial [Pseudomonadota bacterium]
FEIMMYRSFLGIVIVMGVAYVFGTHRQITGNRLGLHFVRNLCHFAGQNLWFFALPLIPLAQLFALEFTSPVWVILLAPIFLGERLTGRKSIIAALGFAGVLIVARPDTSALNIGIIAGALAAIGFAGAAIATRELTRTETITSVLFYLTVMQAVFGVITAYGAGPITWPTAQTAPGLAIIGIAGLAAQFCMTKALYLPPASVVMPVDFIRLPVIALIGYMFYAETLDTYTILGAAIILAANYLNIRQKT